VKLGERERECVSSAYPWGGEAAAAAALNLKSSLTPGMSRLATGAAARPPFFARFAA